MSVTTYLASLISRSAEGRLQHAIANDLDALPDPQSQRARRAHRCAERVCRSREAHSAVLATEKLCMDGLR